MLTSVSQLTPPCTKAGHNLTMAQCYTVCQPVCISEEAYKHQQVVNHLACREAVCPQGIDPQRLAIWGARRDPFERCPCPEQPPPQNQCCPPPPPACCANPNPNPCFPGLAWPEQPREMSCPPTSCLPPPQCCPVQPEPPRQLCPPPPPQSYCPPPEPPRQICA
eukprot:Sspe_Gene.35277::Locus_17107_Transcript_1_1_Confidence_1.000_Length_832::g.35277::m.35277